MAMVDNNPFLCSVEEGSDMGGGEKVSDDKTHEPQENFGKMILDLSSTLEKSLKSLRSEIRSEIQELKKNDVTMLQEQLKRLEEQVVQRRDDKDTTQQAKGTTDELLLRQQYKEMQDKLAQLQEQLNTERAARQAAEQARINTERDRLLHNALIAAEAIDPDFAVVYFRDKLIYNEDDGKWYYRDGDEQIKVEDGVKKYLPNYMRRPKSPTQGGSGGRSPQAGDLPSSSKKTQLKQAAIELGIAARRGGGQFNDISKYQRAKREALSAGVSEQEIVAEVNAARI